MSTTNSKVAALESQVSRVVGTSKTMQDGYLGVTEDLQELETIVEKIDNAHSRNNVKLRGLREGVEVKDLVGFLTEFFTGWAGTNSDIDINIEAAYWVGILRTPAKFPRNIIIKFTYWVVKSKVLELFWEQPSVSIDNCSVQLLPDLSVITSQRRKGLKFLTSDLRLWNIPYRWGFPCKLLFEHQSKFYFIKSLDKAQ